jgi:predicted KAP-like P-loop ATPase
MWADNETEIDFLNFTSVADTVAEIIVQADRRPVSIGVSGAWGVGKSSMIKLIRGSLANRDGKPSRYLFVEFNAWLYQGYDDVRASMLEIIANALKSEAEERKTGIDKASELLSRVDWLRVGRLTVGTAASLALGLPPTGLFGEMIRYAKEFAAGKADEHTVESAEIAVGKTIEEGKQIIRPKPDSSPPKEIHAIRECFEQTLQALDVTLVVLIDDLDRCLPETTISTLEAIRLFLFLKSTAFVIAADNEMIKHAVRKHFDGLGDNHVTNYFDKLIQVPIRVPPLGTQEVRAYIMLLFVEASSLSDELKDRIRTSVCRQLAASWQGKRVDRAFMQTLEIGFPGELIARFDTADRLAPIMTTASQIGGNPRLIKRFLNALSVRVSVANAHGITVDEAVLAKLLLFERCGNPDLYMLIAKAVTQSEQGKPRILEPLEARAKEAGDFILPKEWDDPFIREWLTIPPLLAELDLRGALYVSRDHVALITPADRLSSEAADLLTALLDHPDMAASLSTRIAALQRQELTVILDRLLERAHQVQQWGVPPILDACLAVTRVDSSQGPRLAAFLEKRPCQQITAPIIPKISGEPWAEGLFAKWRNDSSISQPVKKAIQKVSANGNV